MAKPKKKSSKTPSATIAQNKKVRHDYFVEERFEAGIVLEGWEVKSLRDGHIQLKESFVHVKNGEAWLSGAHISPLQTASTHVHPDPVRPRKLLLNRKEIVRLIGAVDRQGYTIVPVSMYWNRGKAKLEIGTAKGKKQHDKRATEKDRDWQREKERVLRKS
jgi:SsrA-binding protein